MALLKLLLAIYIAVIAFGSLCSVFRFLADIKRFKDKEERFKLFDTISKEIEVIESEVIENGSDN